MKKGGELHGYWPLGENKESFLFAKQVLTPRVLVSFCGNPPADGLSVYLFQK
jgi:hypothetical protein